MALTDNLVSYWKMDETSDGSGAVTRVDSHGSNNLTDNNTTPSATGKINNACDFELTNSEYLNIADASQSGLDVSGNMSFFAWLNFETAGAVTRGIMGKDTDGAGNRGYNFYFASNNLRVEISSNGSSATTALVAWTPSTATWYHVGFVYNASAGEVAFYVDGAQQGATQTGMPTSIFNNGQDFELGAFSVGAVPFDGLIDEAAIWSKILTTDEITEIYNGGAGLSYDSFGGGGGGLTPRRMLMGVG